MKPQFVLIRGLPGSGKSTLAKMYSQLPYLNFQWFEADQYFIGDDGSYNFDAAKLHDAHQWCISNARKALYNGKNVVVSNTFTTTKELKPYFDIAKHEGIVPHVILMQNNYGSIHNVPEESLKKMKERFRYDLSELDYEI